MMKNNLLKSLEEQYSTYPYPFPVVEPMENRLFLRPLDLWEDGMLPKRILILGCGTSTSASIALNYPQAEILAIDLSLSSIDLSKKLCKKHEIRNVIHRCSSIEDFLEENRNEKFDLIHISGVLHHLENREQVLRKIGEMLLDCGRVLLMVYGKTTKSYLKIIRKLFDIHGFHPNRNFKEMLEIIRSIPVRHPAYSIIKQYNDYLSVNGMIDMFYHVHEECFYVEDLLKLIKDGELFFYNWFYRSIYNYDYFKINYGKEKEEKWKVNELINGTIGRHIVILSKENVKLKPMDDLSTIYFKLLLDKNGNVEDAPPELQAHKIVLNPVERKVYSEIKDGISVTQLYEYYNLKQKISKNQLFLILNKFYTLDLINYRVGF